MSLKDLNLKGLYDSDKDDLLNDFYIKVLSESIIYKRIAGFFCSNSLAIAAEGIYKFIENGGRIQLIANVIISEKDQTAIKKAIEEKESHLLKDIESLEDSLKKGHIKLLAWMIKNNKLEIKIAVVQKGIEHKKKGILEDKYGNKISFSGSDNETVKGWLDNDEEFHVFCDWIEGDNKRHLKPDIESFDRLWSDKANDVKVFPVSQAFRLGIIKQAPKYAAEFKELSNEMVFEMLEINKERVGNLKNKKIKPFNEEFLRDYQREAIKKWEENNYQGIFEMATGTGKTFTSIGCLNKLLQREKKMLIVISCPYQHLVEQWRDNIKRFEWPFEIIEANSSNHKWIEQVSENLLDLKNGVIDYLTILTTHDTFYTKKFRETLKEVKIKSCLIVDEVHGIGSEQRKEGLVDIYKYKLGLSATPERWFDEIGTKAIRDFFGKTVYQFTLKDAINAGFLVKYNYKPYFVELTEGELNEYESQTKKLAKSLLFSKDPEEKERLFTLLCVKRQKIVVNARNKIKTFQEILESLKEINHLLIYCSPEQIDKVQDELNEREILQHRFTGVERTNPEKKYGYLSERQFLLSEFEKGKYSALVAMKCLDEGVDVPPAKMAIILASSGNPKEYIQRRGRILRPYLGKERATIYDLIVIPPIIKIRDENLLEIEKRIVEKELIRYMEFSDSSDNKLECLNKIYKVQEHLNAK